MIKVKGKYNTAHVFTDYVDPESHKGILSFLNSKAAVGSCVRIMPDFHAGAGCVIGTTATIKDYVIPNVVGVDISCGVLAFEFNKPDLDLKAVDAFIHSNIPAGGGQVNQTPFESRLITWPLSKSTKEFSETLEDLCKTVGCNYDYISASLGSLGGGNHYIEIDQLQSGNYLLVVHSGSRYLGLSVAGYWQSIADSYDREEYNRKVHEIRSKYNGKEIENRIKALKTSLQKKGYLDGRQKDQYIEHSLFCNDYAYLNRFMIATNILNFIGAEPVDITESVHNFISDDHILRKGAISAKKGEKILIPLNMKDGIVIGIGKGNPEWNYSAPHGAGRKMSRKKAKEIININTFKESMSGIYSTTVCKSTLDEAPDAYKDPQDILDRIPETCYIVEVARPIYNFKGVK